MRWGPPVWRDLGPDLPSFRTQGEEDNKRQEPDDAARMLFLANSGGLGFGGQVRRGVKNVMVVKRQAYPDTTRRLPIGKLRFRIAPNLCSG